MSIDDEGRVKRAMRAGRTLVEQTDLEMKAFQMGYKYCNLNTSVFSEDNPYEGDNYVHSRFLAGQELGRRILRIQGKMFA